MDDMERYGDYNEIDAPPGKSIGRLIVKIVVALICLSVASVLIIRIAMANHYPDFAENIYFDEVLTEHYKKTGGNIGAETQMLMRRYDDPDEGNIFCQNLIIIREINQLQIAVKFNKSVEENLAKKFGKSPDTLSGTAFTFRLVRNNPEGKTADTFSEKCVLGTLSVKIFDTGMQYGYYKLVFNGVDFDGEEYFSGKAATWIRLETFLDDGTGTFDGKNKFTQNLIYQNDGKNPEFVPYELSDEEVPA
ncbi:MAG: hypothetical protein IKB38_05920 [Clostridia bacterium]|nr:hypothetical protein [Clostridia bacterium]